MAVESVLNELGVKANIEHSDMLSAASKHEEIFIEVINFKPHFDHFQDFPNNIYLQSLVNHNEILEKMKPVLEANGWL